MRVLHVIPTVSLAYGGPSVAIRALTLALAARGHDVTIATTDAADDRSGRLDVPIGEPSSEAGVTYRYFPRSAPGRWMFSWPLTRWLYREVRSFDVVHVHGLFQYPTIPACRFARWHRVPYVIRPLGMLDAWSLAQHSWKKRPYLSLVENSHIRHAAALHATSEAEASHVRATPARRVVVIPLGVDAPPEGQARADAAGRSGPMRVLFLSRIHPKKGIPVLLEALRQARAAGAAIEAMIAGSGSATYEAELRKLADTLGVADIVSWAGQVEGPTKHALFSAADVFVLPSSQENFGIAVAEALSAGVPALVSHEVAIGAELEAAGAGRSLPIDPASFAVALVEYASNPAARAAAGRAAAAFAERSYSWPVCAERVEALYRDITSSARR